MGSICKQFILEPISQQDRNFVTIENMETRNLLGRRTILKTNSR